MRPPHRAGRAPNGVRVTIRGRRCARGACLLAIVTALLALPAAARAASAPGWQMSLTRHYGIAADASGFSSVIALGRDDAWAFGGTNPGGDGAPVAMQWNGASWRPWRLPAGLTDFISDASASSPRDIWAVSYAGGYALHWNGVRWTVAKRWRRHAVLTGVTALSPSDVWAFGTASDGDRGLGTWHFDGRRWSRAGGLAADIYRASARSADDIWAVAATRQGVGFLEHYDGRSWRRAGGATPALAGLSLDAVLAPPGGRVWAAGNLRLADGDGDLVIVGYDGRSWFRIRTRYLADTERLAPDGKGGIWITADEADLVTGALVGHLTAWGRLTWMPVRGGLGSGVSDIAAASGPGPGPWPVWLSGGFLTQSGGDAAIWAQAGAGPATELTAGARSATAVPAAPAVARPGLREQPQWPPPGGPWQYGPRARRGWRDRARSGAARPVLRRRRGQRLGQVLGVEARLDAAQVADPGAGLGLRGAQQRAAVLIGQLRDRQRADRARLGHDLVLVQADERAEHGHRHGVVARREVGERLAGHLAEGVAGDQGGGPQAAG